MIFYCWIIIYIMNTLKIEQAMNIVSWYKKNKRFLPWHKNDAYAIWISEIMLQQTRIEAVKPKYIQFMNTLPTMQSLAECDDDTLMRLWEGLGYYSRARNLKKCAQVVCQTYHGVLPADYQTLLTLPGIGSYTAGAISSIAYHRPVSAIDGNVLRVLTRYFEINEDVRLPQTKDLIEQSLTKIYHSKQKGDFFSAFNQGLMEIGETICTPSGKPNCQHCPLSDDCKAYKNQTYEAIPYRSKLKKRKIIKRTILVIRDGSSFLLHKRDNTGLLANLYEFIGVDTYLSQKEMISFVQSLDLQPIKISKLPDSKHIFTHLEWHMKGFEVQVEQIASTPSNNYVLATKKELSSLAIPSAFKTYINWYDLRSNAL